MSDSPSQRLTPYPSHIHPTSSEPSEAKSSNNPTTIATPTVSLFPTFTPSLRSSPIPTPGNSSQTSTPSSTHLPGSTSEVPSHIHPDPQDSTSYPTYDYTGNDSTNYPTYYPHRDSTSYPTYHYQDEDSTSYPTYHYPDTEEEGEDVFAIVRDIVNRVRRKVWSKLWG